MLTTLGDEAREALAALANFLNAYAVIMNDAVEDWITGSKKCSEETILALKDGNDWSQRAFNELCEFVFTPLLQGNTETHCDRLHKFINAPLEYQEWHEEG